MPPPPATATLLHAAGRVASRALAIQLDEVAALSAAAARRAESDRAAAAVGVGVGAGAGPSAGPHADVGRARAQPWSWHDAALAGVGGSASTPVAPATARPAELPTSRPDELERAARLQATPAAAAVAEPAAATRSSPSAMHDSEPVQPPVLPDQPRTQPSAAREAVEANARPAQDGAPDPPRTRPAPPSPSVAGAPQDPASSSLAGQAAAPTPSSAVEARSTTRPSSSTTLPREAAGAAATSSPTPDLASVPGAEAELLEEEDAPVMLRASKVPSSRLGRLFHYGSLAASLSFGAATESIRRTAGGQGSGSVFMSDANVRRLVTTLGRMRGAALKLGQFMSIQDNNVLPPEIEQVLHQVQQHANYMPDWQMEQVLRAELGSDWQSLFATFDRTPVAAASIGQVHRATLPDGTPVALKVQFPGVASSIDSDIANLSLLLRGSAVLPRGLYLQNTIAVMRRELEDECDYVREAAAGRRFAALLEGDAVFQVPRVIDDATTGRVLTTEWMGGKPLSRMKNMSQATRDKIGESVLRLCLQELFQFRFMQTDPNWGNFLYDRSTGADRIQLIDFGASREYTTAFMDGWWRLLDAAMRDDRAAMKVESEKLGYLTGEEEEVMLDAHLESMSLLASPFRHTGIYAFGEQTITARVRALIPVMLQHRLTPPPPETYSLNRKLSGAFLMCAKLGANVDCRALWDQYAGGYKVAP